MSRITPLTQNELAPQEQEALRRAEELMGFTANDALIMARNPSLMHAFSALVAAVYAPGEVSDALKRMLALLTSTAAGCRYCMGHTALSSGVHGIADDKLAAIWDFEQSDLFNAAERAALRVALHAGLSPSGVTDEMFAELKPHFSEAAQLENRVGYCTLRFLEPLERNPRDRTRAVARRCASKGRAWCGVSG